MFKNETPSSSRTNFSDQAGLIRNSSTRVQSTSQSCIPAFPSSDQIAILKFKKSFYGKNGQWTNRNNMHMHQLEIQNREWIGKNLEMTNGLIKWTIKNEGRYQFYLESRSTNYDEKGPALGVNIKLEMFLKKNDVLYLFFADTVFVFNKTLNLIAVPGSAGLSGDCLSNGSRDQDLQNSEKFKKGIKKDEKGYDVQSVINRKNRKMSLSGSGYNSGYKWTPGWQGGSTYVDNSRYKTEIRQNTKIPKKRDPNVPYSGFTAPFIEIKYLN
jgi:hypothetical protein